MIAGCSPSELGKRWTLQEFNEVYDAFNKKVLAIEGVPHLKDDEAPDMPDNMENQLMRAFG